VCREEIGSSNLNFKLASLGMKPSALGRIVREVGSLYERFRRFPTEGFEGAEVSLVAEPAEGVELVGSVDAVFEERGASRLVDWKTGELGAADIQLAFYSLLWALVRRELPARVEAFSVKTGERQSEIPTRAAVEATAVEVAAMVSDVRTVWAGGGTPERRGGPWCRFCPLLDGCAEGAAATDLARS
jgi:hypothetical protein